MDERPRIGVTRWEDVPGEAVDRYWARVSDAGGSVVDLDEAAAGRAAEIVRSLHGLVLTGGIDVDPAGYARERDPNVKETSPERDAMELAVLDAALQRELPVLAICRGHQLMNVAFGGSLLQHIESGDHRADYRAQGYPSRWHQVQLEDGCRLAAVFGATAFEINSRHHQAVRDADLAPGLRAVAFADDHGARLVEAAESLQHRWVVSVQWHPERPEPHKPDFAPLMRRLFDAFVAEAAAARD
ncbi:MAG TPA: gamma-glutamyl-gamma-aminobutyrate hydrolase family protein [Dehalococcoidia bacterium]|nr:gamma-glutamyl-gamma-aminobutyrate hydrolase family protein [Dehalococcoidia bacterium]